MVDDGRAACRPTGPVAHCTTRYTGPLLCERWTPRISKTSRCFGDPSRDGSSREPLAEHHDAARCTAGAHVERAANAASLVTVFQLRVVLSMPSRRSRKVPEYLVRA